MPTTLNRAAYQRLIDEDLAWLAAQPRTLERDHVRQVLEAARSGGLRPFTEEPPCPGTYLREAAWTRTGWAEPGTGPAPLTPRWAEIPGAGPDEPADGRR